MTTSDRTQFHVTSYYRVDSQTGIQSGGLQQVVVVAQALLESVEETGHLFGR